MHMRQHDPRWEPDPDIRYSFKPKKPKRTPEEEQRALQREMRTLQAIISNPSLAAMPPAELDALLGYGPPPDKSPVQASFSVELASSLVKTGLSPAVFDEEDDLDEDEEDSESGPEFGQLDGIGPNTSGIRNEGPRYPTSIDLDLDPDDDGDEFPIPLRTRKGKEPVCVLSVKRKR